MISSAFEEYRREINRYKRMIVYAVIKKNYQSEEEYPYYSLDIEIEIIPNTDEEVEKNIVSQLYKSQDFDTILNYYNNIQKFI